MNVINITQKTNHKTAQIELVISILCLVGGIHLSKTDISVLSYFVAHGIKDSTESLLINSGIIKADSLRNTKTRLSKLGFLRRTKELYKSYELNLDKNFSNDKTINLFIKVDNS